MKHVLFFLLIASSYPSLLSAQSETPETPQAPTTELAEELTPEEQKRRERLLKSGKGEEHPCPPGGIAMGGYDLVSYFQDDQPKRGLETYEVSRGNCAYRFASEKNRDAFRADPERYLPSYGGWCATALAMGRLTCPDFTNFKVENDQLLLFEVTAFTNGRMIWENNSERLRQRADYNFDLLEKSE
ncbi:YHS domain-containing (seleno)protein [Pelagicoccus sp. SDUM812003]|uniref:YHS domain-containing (seleno)protein n=1 Tax=Pelagicoccus sp. SDUM812003 TaxID=3041267 RepID=UPI00280FA754|nr:YHS domain-containing (seleno)protein [Pelagicoccus sp. SDUM812003]MDQ8205284.1 YHS domain-containing (seleno)protein [Pelagicoccus sp. SDUM812003]